MLDPKDSERNVEKRLQDLLAYPREDLDKEYKGWLNLRSEDDQADIAQAVLALANYGGGHIILGFTNQPLPREL